MENSNPVASSSRVMTEQEVFIISDSEDEESSRDKAESPNNESGPDPSDNSGTVSATSDDSESDVLAEVVQLIDWVNFHNCADNNSGENSGIVQTQQKKFMNGYLLIENMQTRFEDSQKVIAERDEHIAQIMGENEKLKSQLIGQQSDFEKISKRNGKLEEERRQRKKNEVSLNRIRSKMTRLQEFFRTVILKLEQEPVNPLDPQSVQKRKNVNVFKKEVCELFNKVQLNLKSWDKNQRDMEEELEMTKIVIGKLNEMVIVSEQIRSMNNTSAPAIPCPSVSREGHTKTAATTPPTFVSSSITAIPGVSTITSANTTPPIPVIASGSIVAHSTKKKKMPPPALLPLTSFPAPRASTSKDMESKSSTPSPNHNQENAGPSRLHGIQQQKQQMEMDSLLSSLTALHTGSVAGKQSKGKNRLHYKAVHNSSMGLPPMPSFNFSMPPTPDQRRPSTSGMRTVTSHDNSMPPPPSPPRAYRKRSSKSATVTSLSAVTSESCGLEASNSLPSTSNSLTTNYPLPSEQPPPCQSSSALLKSPPKSVILKKPKDGQNAATSTKHTLPPLQLPVLHPTGLPQSIEVQVPAVHQREAIEIFGGPATSSARPSGGLNICGLCGMSFNTLVQLKLHHTVVHSKGPATVTSVPAVAYHNPLRPLEFPAVRGNVAHPDRVIPVQQPIIVENEGPLHKRPCLGQLNPFLSSSSSFSLGARPMMALSSHGEVPPSQQLGRVPTTDTNTTTTPIVTSNENSVYSFL